MHDHPRTLSVLPLLLAACALARAGSAQSSMAVQIPLAQAQGQFSNWPLALSVTDPFSGSAEGLRIRAPGVSGGQPVAWSAALFGAPNSRHPDYSIAALTSEWSLPPGTPAPVFGGISTGGDVTPRVDSNGTIVPGPTSWYALNISVKSDAQGVDESLIRSRQQSTGMGGDIFSYYAMVSSGIHASFANTVRVEYTREQLSIGSDLTNLDFGAGVMSIDPGGTAGPMQPVHDRFYFTLDREWTQLVGSIAELHANGSTIYCMSWTGTRWTRPWIAYSHEELFPSVPLESSEIEIDALSVYQHAPEQGAPHDRVVFSLTVASAPELDQILVYQRETGLPGQLNAAVACGTTALQVLASGSLVPVSERFGLQQPASGQPDEVDGGCGTDPRRGEASAPGPHVYPVVGLSCNEPDGNDLLGITTVRTRLPDPDFPGPSDGAPIVDKLHTQVTGLDLDGHPLGLVGIFLHGAPGAPPTLIGQPLLVDSVTSAFNALSLSGTVPVPAPGAAPIRISAWLYGVDLGAEPPIVPLRESWHLDLIY
jgi:hypothetical protein